jgi:acetyl-CoA carboxylase carboxyl transferase subunit beta
MLGRRGASEPEAPPQPERCYSCGASLEGSRSYERYRVCHSCDYHFHLSAVERVALLCDPGTFHEDDRGVTSIDPLSFVGRRPYREQVIDAQRRTGLAESALTGTARMLDIDVVMTVLEYSFLGGSIGIVSGERIARAFERATSRKWPLVSVVSTSGARVAEGLLALMQGPRIIAAAERHRAAGLPHICILTDPATGAAYASFAALADFVLAEPHALVGYAGTRVLRESLGTNLPDGAHTAESHLARGLVDAVVPRPNLRDSVGQLLDLLQNEYQVTARRTRPVHKMRHTDRPAWQLVQLSRHEERPTAPELLARMVTGFVELRGDRRGEDDQAIVAGVASLGGETVVVIGQNRAHEKGLVRTSGFRKATRAISLAARFDLPIVTLLDSAGPEATLANEETGLAQAIGECTAALMSVKVPTIAVITGEGASEAASAMGAADRVLMLDNAIYEVLSPEAAARLVLQEAGRANEMAERLRITSHDCLRMGIIDATVSEPAEGAHTNPEEAAQLIARAVLQRLAELRRMRPKRRLEERYQRYRQIGTTHGSVRGRFDRRMAHLGDRFQGAVARLRRQPRGLRRWSEAGDEPKIPL